MLAIHGLVFVNILCCFVFFDINFLYSRLSSSTDSALFFCCDINFLEKSAILKGQGESCFE